MSEQPITGPALKAWLLLRSGSFAGTRFPLKEGITRVGRAPENDAVLDGPDCATVSLNHLEIQNEGSSWRVRDLGSTNGTWIDGERVTEAEVTPPAQIRLGTTGPLLELVVDGGVPVELNRTIEVSKLELPEPPAAPPARPVPHEDLLSSAVMRARHARHHAGHGYTMTIMRDVVEQALRYSRRRFRIVGISLAIGLLAVSSYAVWKITGLKREKRAIDAQIGQLEAELEKAGDETTAEDLIAQLDRYQNEAQSLEGNLLYTLATRSGETDFVTRELRVIMAEMGAEVYSIPPEFVARVHHYIEQDQGPERPVIARALTESREHMQRIRRILEEEQLPPDLAYIPVVESAVSAAPASAAGAAGPWQFTAATARAFGLRVDGEVDERKDLVKSTRASCKYLRELILDFGAGTSVLLALAAYNSGPAKVKQAVTRNVRDPIKQRNFWYLYRKRALPLETREYVPKVFAVMLIGRHPKQFGF
jgi:pSer/pThr/pTyr-binding forkhead associated (FHA) protein